MAIAEEDRLLYALENLPSGTYEDWDEWNKDFTYFTQTGQLPTDSRYYNPDAPDVIDTGYTQGQHQVAQGQYTGLSELDALQTQRMLDEQRSSAELSAALRDVSAPDRQDAFMQGLYDAANPALQPLDPATATQEEFYLRAFGASGPGQYGEIRIPDTGGRTTYQDIISPEAMASAYDTWRTTGEMPAATPIGQEYGELRPTPAFLGDPYTSQVQSAYEQGLGGTEVMGRYQYEPVDYGDFVNPYGGAMLPTLNPADWAGEWEGGTLGGQFTLSNQVPQTTTTYDEEGNPVTSTNMVSAGTLDPRTPNVFEDTEIGSLPSTLTTGTGTYTTPPTTNAAGQPLSPTQSGSILPGGSTMTTTTSPTGMGGLADLGSYVPGEIRAASEETVAADTFREQARLADLVRRQQRGDVIGLSDLWMTSGRDRAAEARDYLRDYEGRLLGATEDYEAGLDARGQQYMDSLGGILDPYMSRGSQADTERMALSGTPLDVDVTQDPGYQFRMREAQKALQRQRSAAGTMASGGALRELARYSQDLASQEYGQAWNRASQLRQQRLSTLADLGATGARMGAQMGAQVVDPRQSLQNRAGMIQNLAGTTFDPGQIYSQGISALTGTTSGYSDTTGGALSQLGANQSQILANQEARRIAERQSRDARTGQIISGLGTLGGAWLGGK